MLETGSKLSVEITIIYTPKKTIIYITSRKKLGQEVFFFFNQK